MPVFLLGSFIALQAQPGPSMADKPNFIILFADDLGYGDLGTDGQGGKS